MPYYDTPLAANRINATQPLIRNNFTTINAGFSIDHIGYDIGVDVGKHKKITLVQQPAPAFAAGEIGFYNLAGALLYHNLAGVDLDISTLNNTIVAGGVGQGSVTLSSGLILKFGLTQGSNVGPTTINFTNAFSAGGQCIALVSVMDPNFPQVFHASVQSLSATQLKVKTTNYAGTAYHNCYFYWLAIGH